MNNKDLFEGVPRAPGFELSHEQWAATEAFRREVYGLVCPVGENLDMLMSCFNALMGSERVRKLAPVQQYVITIQFVADVIQMIMRPVIGRLAHNLTPGLASVYLPLLMRNMLNDCNMHWTKCQELPIRFTGDVAIMYERTSLGAAIAAQAASIHDLGNVLLNYIDFDRKESNAEQKMDDANVAAQVERMLADIFANGDGKDGS